MSFVRRSAMALIALLAAARMVSAQAATTGDLAGRVTDETGAVLVGASVEAASAALQGTRTTTSDATGKFRLPLLPPGDYKVTIDLQGFAKQTQQVTIGLGKESALNVVMRAAVAEQITVTSEAPVVDTATTSVGTNIETRAIQTLPTGRNYSSLAAIVPGTASDANPQNQDQSTVTVYGSSGAENAFYIDGVNTTNVEYGFQGKELNFEFIQEIDVKTGGYEAEFGKATGGIINVITKSGGNQFRGDAFGYYDNDSLQSSTKSVQSPSGVVAGFTKEDYGADLGGYFVKDKLWFFGAYDRVDNTTKNVLPSGPAAGQIVDSKSKHNLGSFKLTYNVAQGQSLVATFFQDPRTDTGAINDANHTLNGDPLTYLGQQEFGGKDYALRYDALLGSNLELFGQAARHQERNSVGPASAAGDIIEYRDQSNDAFQTGGFGEIDTKDFKRDGVSGSLTRFWSTHEVKFGIDYEKENADVTKRMSGGQRVDVYRNDVNPGLPIYDHFYWTTATATVDNAPTSELNAPVQHKNSAVYLQDRWAILPNLTLSYGLRWDRQEIFDRFGNKVIDLKKDYAPRHGIVWDPSAKGTSKAYASFGQYYEQIPMDLVIRSFAQERQPHIINYSPTSTTPDPNAESDFGTASRILGGYSEPADPNMKNQYLNEFIAGYETEVRPNVAVGAKAIYRDYGRIIEDFVCDNQYDYCIGNPGEGIMKRIFTYDVSTTYPAPKPKRTFKGVELTATKRFSDNWQGLVSYLYSHLDGNYDGEYSPFTNVGADPNISAMYDYYEFFTDGRDFSRITNDGPLSNDRRHQFKFSGLYITPFKLSIGVSGYYRTGTPLTRYGFWDGYNRYELFLTKRGAEGRTPDIYEADVHLGYPLQTGPVTINLMLDIFNILNAQRPVLLDERWDFQQADNYNPTPTNPNYGKPVLRTPPTSVRIGLRLSF